MAAPGYVIFSFNGDEVIITDYEVDRTKEQYAHIGRTFANKGVATAVVQYTLSPKRISPVVHPVHVRDIAAAYHWLRQNAERFGCDKDKIFLSGHSAGGHMCGLLTLDERYLKEFGESPSSIRGVIGIQGIYDLIQLSDEFPSYDGMFLKFAFGDSGVWRDASPQFLVPSAQGTDLPPWLVIHAPKDSLVSTIQATNFQKHLKSLSLAVQPLQENLDGDHFDGVATIGAGDGDGAKLTNYILQFIQDTVEKERKQSN